MVGGGRGVWLEGGRCGIIRSGYETRGGGEVVIFSLGEGGLLRYCLLFVLGVWLSWRVALHVSGFVL